MKKFIAFIALFVLVSGLGTSDLKAQQISNIKTTATFNSPNWVPFPYVVNGPLINIANAYAYKASGTYNNVYTDTPATGSTTTYFYIGTNGNSAVPKVTPKVAVDTFVPSPVFGKGYMFVQFNVLKISGTPGGSAYLQLSNDGLNWATYRSYVAGADTLTIANVATTQSIYWSVNKTFTYARVVCSTSGTQQSATWGNYCFTADQWYPMK